MDSTLLLLAVWLIPAVTIAVIVFAVSARANVSEPGSGPGSEKPSKSQGPYTRRAPTDRRSGAACSFPCKINGLWIEADRRSGYDRRLHAG